MNNCQRIKAYFRAVLVRTLVSSRDDVNNLHGVAWLIPLMLHREAPIRSLSFSLLSSLISAATDAQEPITPAELPPQLGRLSRVRCLEPLFRIAMNTLLNNYECSLVRTQACTLLINYTKSLSAICVTYNQQQIKHQQKSTSLNSNCTNSKLKHLRDNLHALVSTLKQSLVELKFFQRVFFILNKFYPFKSYNFYELKYLFYGSSAAANKEQNKFDYNYGEFENNNGEYSENDDGAYDNHDLMSISSPTLIGAICHLLTNIMLLFSTFDTTAATSAHSTAAATATDSGSSLSSARSSVSDAGFSVIFKLYNYFLA